MGLALRGCVVLKEPDSWRGGLGGYYRDISIGLEDLEVLQSTYHVLRCPFCSVVVVLLLLRSR